MLSPDATTTSLGLWLKFAAVSLTVWPALGLYFLTATTQRVPPVRVEMPTWVPFWPLLALPYLSLLPVAWLLPLAIRDTKKFGACLLAFAIAFILVFPWWIVSPTFLQRPPMPTAWWTIPYQWLAFVDPPHNIMPCAHGIGPVVAAWFVARDRPTWSFAMSAMLCIGLPVIALVYQHRPIDILLGTVASAIGIACAELLNARRRSSPARQSNSRDVAAA